MYKIKHADVYTVDMNESRLLQVAIVLEIDFKSPEIIYYN